MQRYNPKPFSDSKLSKPCHTCKHSLVDPSNQANMLCMRFFAFDSFTNRMSQGIDASVARFSDYDLCGSEGKYHTGDKK